MMKRYFIFFFAFALAFLFGVILASYWLGIAAVARLFDEQSVSEIEVGNLDRPIFDRGEVPEFDPDKDYPQSLKVKLLQTGELHSEEVPYSSGEKWLGLFRIGDGYELRRNILSVRPAAGEGLFDREVLTSEPFEAVFLLRGAADLLPGRVTTVFDVNADGEYDFSAGKSFGLKGQFWNLWIENASPEGFLQKGSSLVLGRLGFPPQVLRNLPDGCDDCGWRLLWAGDLDRDTDLDFLIDVSGHYNSEEPALFLSSASRNVGLVGLYSSFYRVGC